MITGRLVEVNNNTMRFSISNIRMGGGCRRVLMWACLYRIISGGPRKSSMSCVRSTLASSRQSKTTLMFC